MLGAEVFDPMEFHDLSSLDAYSKLSTPIWVFDLDGFSIWWANDKALELWQADTLYELQERNFFSNGKPVQLRLESIFAAAENSGPVIDSWTLDLSGEPKKVVVACHSIRITKKQRALLIEAKGFSDDLIDPETIRVAEASRVAQFLISTFTLDGELIAQNPSSADCYKNFVSKNGKRNFAERINEPLLAEQLLNRLREGEEFALEADVLTSFGKRRHLVSARKGRDPISGELVAVVAEQDVTNFVALRRHHEQENSALTEKVDQRTQELELSQKRYQIALATAAIWDWELSSRDFFLSSTFWRMLGFDAPENNAKFQRQGLFGLSELMVLEQRRSFIELLTLYLKDPTKPLRFEFCVIDANGKNVWIRAEGNCIAGRNGRAVRSVGLLTEITDEKLLEEKFLASQRLEAVGQLTGGIAHDFNNILTVILGNAELQKENGNSDPELMDEVISAVKRGAELTSHLLAFSRKQALNPCWLDIGQLLEAMKSSLLRTLGEDISIKVSVPKDTWKIFVDPNQMQSAILNLAINARDAMESPGTIKFECENHVVGSSAPTGLPELPTGSFVALRVTDNGVGMTESTRTLAFEPFFTTKEVGKGSGLGLSMVSGFAKQSGGACDIISKIGFGTTVTLTLPAGHGEPSSNKPKKLALKRGAGQLVHLVDDDALVRSAIAKQIKLLGYRVTWSENGVSVLKLLESGKMPDFLLIDVVLAGGITGPDLVKEVRAVHPDLPLCLMSGHPGVSITAIEASGLSFLNKPFVLSELSDVLTKGLTSKRAHSNQ